MRHDILADILSTMRNSDHVGKKEVITPASKLAKEIMLILQKHEYIGNFELIEDGKGMEAPGRVVSFCCSIACFANCTDVPSLNSNLVGS